MLKTLNLSKPLRAGYRGTDGYGDLTGIELMDSHPNTPGSRVMLLPMRNGTHTFESKLEIPIGDIPEFIRHLQSFVQ